MFEKCAIIRLVNLSVKGFGLRPPRFALSKLLTASQKCRTKAESKKVLSDEVLLEHRQDRSEKEDTL